jgi:uncharacterized caspase-like protein/regulator of sirC expression with transglutaminase-like and TPR domain
MLRAGIVLLLVFLLPSAAHAQKRVGLVIGNSSYQHAGELTNPKNDAADMAAALRMRGFQVIDGFDLNKAMLDRKLRDFATALEGAEVGLFFYAGHGLQVSGQNYIVPVDAELMTASALDFETVRLDLVQRIMERTAPTNIMFLDACRNNPLARNLARALGTRSAAIERGLAPVESGVGTLISFSTQPGNVALDGAGRNSPFAGALVKHISASTDDLSALLIDVRNDVMRETQRKQVPWEHSALTGRFYFSTAANPFAPTAPATLTNSGDVLAAADRALKEGKVALDRKDFDRAVIGFSEAIRLDPNSVTALANRGIAYGNKNDLDKAIADFSNAIRLEPKNSRALNGRGYAYFRKNDLDRALDDYNEAIRLDPNYVVVINNRGLLYLRRRDYDRAFIDFSEAIRLDPNYVHAFSNRGLIYAEKKQFDLAISEFNKALKLNPNYDNALYGRGLAKLKKGDKSGEADIAKARQLNSSIGR